MGNRYNYRRFDRAHARGPKVSSGLCLYIGLLVTPATNTVKLISNEVGLRLLYYGMFHIPLFICGDPTRYQHFPKRLC